MDILFTLKRFRNAINGYIEQLKAADEASGMLMPPSNLEAEANELAKQLGWWTAQEFAGPFRRRGEPPLWLEIYGTGGAFAGGSLIWNATPEQEAIWGRDAKGFLQVPTEVIKDWHRSTVRHYLPPLLSWITKADDSIMALEAERMAALTPKPPAPAPEAEAAGANAGEGKPQQAEQPDPDTGLPPSRIKAKAAYDWAMQTIDGAGKMTVPELHDAIMHHPQGPTDCIPDNAEAFGKYLRDAGVKRYDGTGKRRLSRNVRRPEEL